LIHSKLKTELKTTNLKELKSQNERLRVELSRALLNEKDILIDERLPSRNG
jgi:ATPase subunit of ABC transporter with duplicated ATPase domains